MYDFTCSLTKFNGETSANLFIWLNFKLTNKILRSTVKTNRKRMHKLWYIYFFLVVLVLILQANFLCAQNAIPDTALIYADEKQEQFYDSLEYRAHKGKLTSWLYDILISPPRPAVDKKALALNYFNRYEGLVIARIDIKPLDIFGPSLSDTTKQAANWAERFANKIHTKSNLKTIRKQLLFKIGDILDPEVMYENERLLRQLDYIKDVRFIVEQDSTYSAFANVTVLMQDRFSFGASGGVNGTTSGDVKVYNENIFGIGHEFSVKFVGHVNKEPYLGLETYYKINKISGRFLDMELGYLNTFRDEGFTYKIDKPFITTDIKWGYGLSLNRFFRTDNISDYYSVDLQDPLNESYCYIWGGHNFNLNHTADITTQFTLAAAVHNYKFFEEPSVDAGSKELFANRTLYMLGLNLSQRHYLQDQLVYSYGITEDIPEGFKHELLYGFDANEFGNRHYLQLSTSTGSHIKNCNGYLFFSGGIGGYISHGRFEQGQVFSEMELITKLSPRGSKQVRSFINVNYTLGIRRYDMEYLTLDKLDYIRGFNSDRAIGKQRLALNLEHVIFLPKQFYRFNMALFGFADMGLIGSSKKIILTQNYYSGIGLGIRLHNENLVFETFRLRLAFYPFHPKDMSLVGFVLNEQSKRDFMSFQPVLPAPMTFE